VGSHPCPNFHHPDWFRPAGIIGNEGRLPGVLKATSCFSYGAGRICGHRVEQAVFAAMTRLDLGASRGQMRTMDAPFWKTKTLEAMTPAEWESLCDGCGKCCLSKLEDEDTGEIYWTSVGCRLFDAETCRCADYANRLSRVPDCVGLTPQNVRTISWLPRTCAYRLVAEGHDLYWWHRLVSGSSETVHEAGISIRGRVKAKETDLAEPDDYFDYMLDDEP
jgi:uncharacterized cysteine cluster protein YcgN (CxxCxxCC family)